MTDVGQLNDALAANYMLVDLEIRSWSGNKTDRAASKEFIASKGAVADSGRFIKALLAGADTELEAVKKLAGCIRTFVRTRTLPWCANNDGIKHGSRIIAATETLNFLRGLNEIKREYDAAVAALVAVWPARVASAVANLSGLANVGDYPNDTELGSLFGVHVDLRPVPTMSDFTRINVPTGVAEALGQRHALQAEQQVSVALDSLKEQILQELARMAKQMGKVAANEKTRIYDSLVTNLQTLVRLARTMNVSNNPALTELADKIEQQLLSQPVSALKNSVAKAAVVAASAQQLAIEAAMENVWKIE